MERKTPRLLIGLLIGLPLGLMTAGFVVGFMGFVLVKKTEQELRREWPLVPVAVALQDMHEGEVVTADKVAQRSVPELLVTPSVIKPDVAVYIFNQRLNVPVHAGDMLLWSQFETKKDSAPSTP
jgi:Flp pilus assembly protein CpaB